MLRRSESELREVLQYSHHLIDEPNARELRPLHLSVGWPVGVEILLNYGANVNVIDEQGYYPIDHAIQSVYQESVALLGKADCALRPSSRKSKGTLGLAIALAACCFVSGELKVRIAESVIMLEANQRRKLQALVSDYLPESSVWAHLSVEDKLLDRYMFDAVAALKQHHVSVPFPLKLNEYKGTVYHLLGLTSDMLNSLWKAGFRDINEPDSRGRTPLILPDFVVTRPDCLEVYLERVHWFLDKGVDPDQRFQDTHQNSYWKCNVRDGCSCMKSGHTAMHFLAVNLSKTGLLFKYQDQSPYLKDTRARAVLRDIVNNETRDACKCACSLAGCQANNILVKTILSTSFTFAFIFFRNLPFEDIFRMAIWPVPAAKANDFISETTFVGIIRALTFRVLGLTHTCCRESDDSYFELQLTPFEDEDDISEIHDEEREDLQLLEDLLLEFEQHRRESPSSYRKFLNGYWSSRMREVLSEQSTLDEMSDEESLDENELRKTEAEFDDTSSRQKISRA